MVDKHNTGEYDVILTTNIQDFIPVLNENQTKTIRFQYHTPTMDTIGAGVSQDFSIILKASMFAP